MRDALSKLLAQRDWLLADGATGTELFNLGLSASEPAELWNTTKQQVIEDLHARAIDAGADLFLTNTYGANTSKLALHGLADRVAELNTAGAEIARNAADRAGRGLVVAGSVGPTGEIMEPMGPFRRAAAIEIFHAQIEALKAGGVDLIWLETFSDLGELRAAVEACAMVGIAWCGAMNFDTGGRSMMGDTPAQLAALAARLPHKPLAIGANCGVGLPALLRSVQELAATGVELPLIAKGNAGVPQMQNGHIHYDATPERMAEYALQARGFGARIIGGCCGTTPLHLAAMRAALEATPDA